MSIQINFYFSDAKKCSLSDCYEIIPFSQNMAQVKYCSDACQKRAKEEG